MSVIRGCSAALVPNFALRLLLWLACRTAEDIVVNLPDVADASLAGYCRA